jgi:hypothetical protein
VLRNVVGFGIVLAIVVVLVTNGLYAKLFQ